MSYRDLALSMDAQERPVEAAWAYEIAIQGPQAELGLFLNLAVLYFACEDTGYSSHHHLEMDFVGAAYDRIHKILDAAENRFGSQTEINFWRLYIPEFGPPYNEPSMEEYEELARRGDSLMPHYRLYVSSNGTRYREEAKALLSQVRDGSTERKRYIRSVLESAALPRLM
jgi:hypothetical protein